VTESGRPPERSRGDGGCGDISIREDAFRVRPARLGDLASLARIEVQSHPNPWSRDSIASFLAARGVIFLVAELVAEAVPRARGETAVTPLSVHGFGIMRWAADQGEIVNLAVAPPARGGGVGSTLLDSLLEIAGDLGLVSIFLEVRASNLVAEALYLSRGFREVGVRRQYYSRPVEDARVLQLLLGSAPAAPPALPTPSEES